MAKADVLKHYYRDIFTHELRAWHKVEQDWPKKRDFLMFMAWFEAEVHSMVLDIHKERLEREPLEL